MKILGFNLILQAAGVAPASTRLVRHQDKHGRSYDLWRAGDGSFERYQCIQSRPVFCVGDWLASFVATPLGETLFVGMYRVRGLGVVANGEIDPLGGRDVSGLHEYAIDCVESLSDYAGRLVVEWGEGYRSWVQRADRQDKQIVELRKTVDDPPFPGFDAFVHTIRSLASVPPAWRTTLSAVSGVYLLVSRETGKQYVGSAVGPEGFWGRWVSYAANGHGGNVGLQMAAESDYQVSILEVASSAADEGDVLRLESKWKKKLLSREFGLNCN